MMTLPKVNLLNYTYQQLRNLLSEWGEQPYRSQQIIQWIHQTGLVDFNHMTNIGKALKEKLDRLSTIALPEIVTCQKSSDGMNNIKMVCHMKLTLVSIYP